MKGGNALRDQTIWLQFNFRKVKEVFFFTKSAFFFFFLSFSGRNTVTTFWLSISFWRKQSTMHQTTIFRFGIVTETFVVPGCGCSSHPMQLNYTVHQDKMQQRLVVKFSIISCAGSELQRSVLQLVAGNSRQRSSGKLVRWQSWGITYYSNVSEWSIIANCVAKLRWDLGPKPKSLVWWRAVLDGNHPGAFSLISHGGIPLDRKWLGASSRRTI